MAGAFGLVLAGAILIKPIIWPVIIRFPWDDDVAKEDRVVILAGSYNPPHRGHLAMLEYLSKRCVYGSPPFLNRTHFCHRYRMQVFLTSRTIYLRQLPRSSGCCGI